MTFLSPLLLYGLLLASAPIIIHLLNRRRFVRVEWAPMEYLKLTLKTNRRRIQLEHWLLLAVRTLAVLLLFLAVARPVLSGTGLAALLSSQGRTERVIVLDDSMSMGLTNGGRTSLARAKEALSGLLEKVRNQDSITLLTASQPDTPLVRQASIEDPASLKALVDNVVVAHSAARWSPVFAQVDRHLEQSAFPLREVVLLTDLRAEGWDAEVAALTEKWSAKDVMLNIVDVGTESTGNAVLESLVQDEPIALVNTRIPLTARVRNDGAAPIAAQQITLNVDGEARSVSMPEITAGAAIDIALTVSLDSPGWHQVSLSLPADSLPEDNDRHIALDVRSSFHLSLVDGEPDSRAFEGETDFLALALSVGAAPWQVTQTTDAEWLAGPLTPGDVLLLANVAAIPPKRAEELQALVEAGLGLVIFVGDQIDPNSYNESLFRDGAGLLPAKINRIRDQEVTGLVIEQFPDSPLAALSRVSAESLAKIKPRRFAEVSLAEDKKSPARVLARWNDPQQSPAVIEKRVGRGRVLLWTMTADREWSDWPTEPSYLLAARQTTSAVAARTSERNNLSAGSPIRVPLDKQSLPTGASLSVPNQDHTIAVSIDQSTPDAPYLNYDRTTRAGIYRMKWQDPALGETSQIFAVSPDIRESKLAALPEAQLARWLSPLKPTIVRFGGESLSLAAGSAELWRSAVIGLLALVVIESSLAAWVGRER